jgi:hypothetical protein
MLGTMCLVSWGQAPLRRALTARRAPAPSSVVIPASEIRQTPPLVKLHTAEPKTTVGRLALPGHAAVPQAPNMGLQTPPKGKLNLTLTPAKPAYFNLAYLKYEYPRSVYIGTGTAYAEYSKHNVPGFFSYTVRLEKGKKYLLELSVEVEPKGKALAYSIGGQQSTHTLGSGVRTISTTVEPESTGWVSGTLHQANTGTPDSWRVHSLSVKEL